MLAEGSPWACGFDREFLLSLDNIAGGVYQSGLLRSRKVWDFTPQASGEEGICCPSEEAFYTSSASSQAPSTMIC